MLKLTPIKPTTVYHGKPFGKTDWYTFYCPTCKRQVTGKQPECACSQKLEWESK